MHGVFAPNDVQKTQKQIPYPYGKIEVVARLLQPCKVVTSL